MITNIVIYTQGFGISIRIIRKGYKRCGAMVDSVRNAVWDVSEVGFARCERGREYDGVNVLPAGYSQRLESFLGPYSLDIEAHRGHARKYS